MAKKKDYIPRKQHDFNVWQENLVAKVVLNAALWLIASGKITALQAAQAIFTPLYTAWKVKTTRTQQQIDAYTIGAKTYKAFLRSFVKENLVANTAIPHDDKKMLGINPGREGKGFRKPIDSAPNVVMKALGSLEIGVECRVEADSSRPSMHPEADVIEFRTAISAIGPGGNIGGPPPVPGQMPPTTWEQALTVSVSTKAKFTMALGNPDLSGMWLYVFARYKNNTDDKKSGKWSEVAHVKIV
jgi:hypothetical protein